MSYTHFSTEERCCLQEFYKTGYSYRKIAKLLGRNVSSVSRELRRNCTHMYEIPSYYPHTAQKNGDFYDFLHFSQNSGKNFYFCKTRFREKNREKTRENEPSNCKLIFVKKIIKKALTSEKSCVIIYGLGKKARTAHGTKNKNTEESKMSTFMANANNIERRWFVIDAAGKPLGRTAVKAANILRGKHRPEFTPHADCGEFVIIVNASKAVLTGKKLEQKYYRHHSGYIGGLKEIQYKSLMNTRPEKAMELAVKGMLPHNSIGAKSFTRLHVYAGEKHDNAAQQPIVID